MPRKRKTESEREADRPEENTRRNFLTFTGLLATSVLKAQSGVNADGGLADIADKLTPDRMTPIVPPGAFEFTKLHRTLYGLSTLCLGMFESSFASFYRSKEVYATGNVV